MHLFELFLKFQAKELEGNYLEAARVYEKSNDILSACKLYLKARKLDDAMRVAEETYSPDLALMIATYFNENNDTGSALRFLLRSEYFEEAMKLAFKNEKYELFAQMVKEYVEFDSPDGQMPLILIDCVAKVGVYFESVKDYYRAGKCHFMAGDAETVWNSIFS